MSSLALLGMGPWRPEAGTQTHTHDLQRMADPFTSRSTPGSSGDGPTMGEINPSRGIESMVAETEVSSSSSNSSIEGDIGTPAAADVVTYHDIEAGNDDASPPRGGSQDTGDDGNTDQPAAIVAAGNNDESPRVGSQDRWDTSVDGNTNQPPAVVARQALENALDLVRESLSSGGSTSSPEGEDAGSMESQALEVLRVTNEALELTRSFVTRSLVQELSNYASSNAYTGCQAPPPFFPSQMPLLPFMRSAQPSTANGELDRAVQIIDQALALVASDVESISNGSHGSRGVESILSGSRELEGMLQGTLDALNTVLPPAQRSSSHRQRQQQQQQHALGTVPTRNTVPSVLENVRGTEVSMLSSTIVDDDENNVEGEEETTDDR